MRTSDIAGLGNEQTSTAPVSTPLESQLTFWWPPESQTTPPVTHQSDTTFGVSPEQRAVAITQRILGYKQSRDARWDPRFLEMAKLVGTWSKDPSTKVGAVIVRPDQSIASVGFNGFPQGMADSEALLNNREEKYSRIIHGEINAYLHCQDSSVMGYTLYTTPFMPCDRCFVQMAQAGIVRFVFPKATAEQLTRWGAAFDKVRKYAQELNVELVELDV